MKIFIENATIVMSDHLIPNASLLISEGRISDFGENIEKPLDAECIDANGLYLGPGLIDIHAHACGEYSYCIEPEKAARHALMHGTTGILPTICYTNTPEIFMQAAKRINAAVDNGKLKNFLGFYLEGPYLNPNYGACRTDLKWEICPDPERYQPIIDEVKERALVWSIAPEREGIDSFVDAVREKIPSIVFSVAHSEAEPWDVEKYIKKGLRLATHHTNATGTIINYPECRGVCVDEMVNYNNDIYAELICDKKGIHVHPYMLRLVRKIKGDDRIILITDADIDDGPVPEGYEGADDIIFDHEGEISGTCLTLDKVCRNMMVHTGCSVCDAFRYASRNPARLLSISDRGEIEKGNIADLILVDCNFNVNKVILSGEIVK